MNFFGLNRSALNSAVCVLVLATASIDCSAGVNAVAIRQFDALSPVSSAAYVTADAQVTRYVTANIDCAGGVYPQVTHTHACTATLNAQAGLVAYVLRSVQASSTVICTAEIIAVVASTMGSSAAAAGATVTAYATRIQAARSTAEGAGSVTWSAEPTAWRMSLANVAGSAAVRAEYSIWQIANPYTLHPSYGDVSGTADVTAEALLSCKPVTALNCVATVSGVGTKIHPGRSVFDASATFIVAEPYVLAGVAAQPYCSATVTAKAVRVLVSSASMASGAILSAAPIQKHAASASLPCSGGIEANGTITQFGQETLQGNSSVTATALRVLVPTAGLAASATFIADATRNVVDTTASASATADFTAAPLLNKIAVANPVSAAEISATAVRVLVGNAQMQLGTADVSAKLSYLAPGYANVLAESLVTADAQTHFLGFPVADISGQAEVTAYAQTHFLGFPIADISGQAEVTAYAQTRFLGFPVAHIDGTATLSASAGYLFSGVAHFGGTAEILADTVTNAASIDPDERTFYRTAQVIDFVRPFIETEFRRAA